MVGKLNKVIGVFIRGRRDQSLFAVLRQGEFTLGRAYDNDLSIQNSTISLYHAKIYTYLTASYIEDLDSTNGTYVDGKRIKKHVIKPGHVIALGEYELVVDERQPAVELETIL